MCIDSLNDCLLYQNLECDYDVIYIKKLKDGDVTCNEKTCPRFHRYWREKHEQQKKLR